jgi:ribonuclease P protein component
LPGEGAIRLRYPKSSRLTESGDFARVKKEGRAFHGRYMVMGVSRNRPSTRFGVVTSRRVGNAVARNRLRRRLREMARLAQARIVPGLWIVLVVLAAAGRATGDMLRAEFVALGTRAGIFTAP